MNAKTLCLSILYEQESTGYEIRRLSVEGECAYFVEASFGSIYPALSKLEEEGLVSSRVEPQEGKPARKVYSITDAGRDAFVQALQEALGEDVFRSPFLLFARFAHLLPRSLVETRAREQLTRIREQLQLLKDAECDHECTAADDWVLGYGREIMGVAERYLENHIDKLIALAHPDDHKKERG